MQKLGADVTERDIWQSALEILKKEVKSSYYEWLCRARLVATNSTESYILQVGNPTIKEQIEKRALVYVEQAVAEACGSKRQVHVKVVVAPGKTPPNRLARPDSQGAGLFGDVVEPPFHADTSPSLSDALPRNDSHSRIDRRNAGRGSTNSSVPSARSKVTPNRSLNQRNSYRQQYPSDYTAGSANDAVLPAVPAQVDPAPWLNKRYTFGSFIVGSNNRFAVAASQAVAERPGEAYNPLFLYGDVGLGKTHLLHAIANEVIPRGLRVLYVTSETFTNEIINAIRYRTTEDFRTKYRSVDVLLVDDIQFIVGKDSTEEEFFHTFNALYESHKQIVMCSDHPPKDIRIEDRLRSRFEWGLIADIKAPDLETRLAILRTKAEQMGVEMPDSIMSYLAEIDKTNIRSLEGMLNTVVAYAKQYSGPITMDIAREALSSMRKTDTQQRRFSPYEILEAISKHYRVSIEDLRGKQRDKRIVVPRQVAMWMMRKDTDSSLIDIGSTLGGRDHSTVMHGCEKIDKECQNENSQIVRDINAVRQVLNG